MFVRNSGFRRAGEVCYELVVLGSGRFRKKTEKERVERFDTIMADINQFFDARARETQAHAGEKHDEEMLERMHKQGITFDQ